MLRAYGVWHRIGLDAWNIARPALFLVDPDGAIRFSFIGESQEEFPGDQEILTEIVRMEAGSGPTESSEAQTKM